MHDSIGDIVSGVLDAVTDVAVNGGPPDRPRWLCWLWIGIAIVLAIGILAILLWPR